MAACGSVDWYDVEHWEPSDQPHHHTTDVNTDANEYAVLGTPG